MDRDVKRECDIIQIWRQRKESYQFETEDKELYYWAGVVKVQKSFFITKDIKCQMASVSQSFAIASRTTHRLQNLGWLIL